MLRQLLYIVTAISLLAALAVGVMWPISYHHVLHFSIPVGGTTRWAMTAQGGAFLFTKSQHIGQSIITSSVPYPAKRLLVALLLVPMVAILIEVRRRLPRPGGRKTALPVKRV